MKKQSIRKFKTNLTRKGLSYLVKDIAFIYNIDEATVHRWVRTEGLLTIDDKTPAMIYSETLRQFIIYKNNSLKMPIGNEGELPCMKCFLKRRPFKDEITMQQVNSKLFQIGGLCEVCGCKMNMKISAVNEFKITMTWGYKVVLTLPKFTLKYNSNRSTRACLKKEPFKVLNPLKFCPENERIKHHYFDILKNRYEKDDTTISQILYSFNLFEEYIKHSNFKTLNYEIAKNFKKHLKEMKDIKTAYRVLYNLKEFFLWVKEKEGYKKLNFDDIKTLEIHGKDKEKLNAVKPKEILPLATLEEIIINKQPVNEKEERNRALLAFLLLGNGIRIDSALKTKLEDVNLTQMYVYQTDPKTGRPQKTTFLEFKQELKNILINWYNKLKTEYGFKESAPLFPKINITVNKEFEFTKSGYRQERIKPNAVRTELAKFFQGYTFTPHMVRHSLTYFFFECGLSVKEEKAFSQNIGHKDFRTTFNSYYSLSEMEQTQTIKSFDIEQMKQKNKVKKMPEYEFIQSKLTNTEAVKKVFKLLAEDDLES